ncbi:hypothetical protein ELH50_01165 [Rhizobium ruizarguesonis]|uniref:hypothetical protein n=1 Tax=Rhizobium ruizarguesonis TaxID=2081791 RepID=UPI0010315ECE|nr:hypothetical protein [Rhizobium ruizarguesonis]TBB09809.1 hypothetical protein ELH50_01165 [Rhizobium ruizarguesonis]
MKTPEERYSAEISRRLETGDDLEFSLAQLAKAVDASPDDEALAVFLDQLVKTGTATRLTAQRCPVGGCGRVLGSDDTPFSVCPYCHTDYQQEGLEVLIEDFYRLKGETSRDIRWMIVVHGMNSRAAWQEEFSWQIANRLRYSAPVLIYKYGWATIDVLVRPVHRHLAKQMGARIRIAIKHATTSRRPSRPDIIAHSFGTLLLSLILEDPDFDDLRFGRIITAGSIIRPNFDWNRHIARNRIEAVLNHVGAKDSAVPLAQYAIPGAGPGGKVGYAATGVFNVCNDSFGHSDFFEPENLRLLIAEGGLWHSFLTHPLARFLPAGSFVLERSWKPGPLMIRGVSRVVGYMLFVLIAPVSWARRCLDP